MMTLTGISKTYLIGGEPVHALVDIHESIQDGEYLSIMGPSGSGKSTLLTILGCLSRPTAGSYVLDGRDVNTLNDEELSHLRQHTIGFVFQSFHLIPRLTAAANVELPLLFVGMPPAERRTRVAEALELVGLTDRAQHRPSQLSVGQRQRVVIARATIMKPRIILADEPTGNLDSISARQVLELLEGLNAKGLTLVVVTHDPHIAQRAHRMLILTNGRITQRLSGSTSRTPSPGTPRN